MRVEYALWNLKKITVECCLVLSVYMGYIWGTDTSDMPEMSVRNEKQQEGDSKITSKAQMNRRQRKPWYLTQLYGVHYLLAQSFVALQ